MARVQVGYDPRPEGLQTTAAPNIQTVRAREADPNASSAFQLAAALGAPSVQQGLAQMAERVNLKEQQDGRAFANSMTVEELGKQIREGKLLQSKSPAYVATVQHIYGENALSSFERDTISKMERGELKFANQAELDKYLNDYRTKTLEGQSDYTVAGFDKKFDNFRTSISTANTRILDKTFVEQGTQQAQDNLTTVLTDNSGKPPVEAASAILQRYQLLRKTTLLRDEQGKEALVGVLTQAAAQGNQALVEELSKAKLDNGVTVGAVVGSRSMTTILNTAQIQLDKNERQRVDVEIRPFLDAADKGELTGKRREEFDAWVQKNERYVSAGTVRAVTNGQLVAQERAAREAQKAQLLVVAEQSQAAAQQQVRATIDQGGFAFLPQLKVVNPSTGELTDLDQKKVATEYIQERVVQTKMPFDKQVQYWSTNGLQNPEWEKQVQAGVSNIASVGWAYDGKNIGQLNPQGQAAIQRYMEIAAVNPAEADKYAGSKENQRLLSDIKFMMEKGGMPNVSDAAAFVNQANRRGISGQDMGLKREQIRTAVDDIVNPSMFSKPVNWVKTLFGGNESVNMTAIASDVRRRAELLVQSGQVPDAKAAVQASVEYFANPAVTTKINNTLYFNKDLPAVPKDESPGQWMERYIAAVPGKLANDQKLDGSRVRLEPNSAGGFTAWIGGVYLTDSNDVVQTYTKSQISQWIASTYQTELNTKREQENSKKAYKAWNERVVKEYNQRNTTPYGTSAALNYLTSSGAYEYFRQQGALDKPVPELIEIIKKKGK